MFLDHSVCFVSRQAQSISAIKKSLKPPLINRNTPLTRLPIMSSIYLAWLPTTIKFTEGLLIMGVKD